jgi:hypothetical protein
MIKVFAPSYKTIHLQKENTMNLRSTFRNQHHTSGFESQHWFVKISLGILTAVAVCLGGTSGALAQDAKTFPGTFCQASGSSQDMYYSNSEIANRTAATQSVICPIVRDNVAQPWQWLAVRVRDRHATQDITCVAYSQNLDGTTVWSQSRSSAGEGFATLFFNVPLEQSFGTYTLLCQLPPMEANVPSYISTYAIQEQP